MLYNTGTAKGSKESSLNCIMIEGKEFAATTRARFPSPICQLSLATFKGL